MVMAPSAAAVRISLLNLGFFAVYCFLSRSSSSCVLRSVGELAGNCLTSSDFFFIPLRIQTHSWRRRLRLSAPTCYYLNSCATFRVDLSRRSDSVLVCGDVERNPGPVIKYCLPKNLLVLSSECVVKEDKLLSCSWMTPYLIKSGDVLYDVKLRYSSVQLRSLRSTNNHRHLIDGEVVSRIALLGIRANRRRGRRGGVRQQCFGQRRLRQSSWQQPSSPARGGEASGLVVSALSSAGDSLQPAGLMFTNSRSADDELLSGQSIPTIVSRRCDCSRPHRRQRICEPRFFVPISLQSSVPIRSTVSYFVPKFYIINANSLVKPHAFEQLKVDVRNCMSDVVIVVETYFNNKHSNELFSLSGFVLFRRDRVKRKGGGVCVYVRECLDPVLLNETCTLEFSETVFLRINYSGLSYLFCACYHPPKAKYTNTELINMLDSNIESLLQLHDTAFILAGDLNKLNCKQLETKHGLCQLVVNATRRHNILDVFFTTRPDLFEVKVMCSCVKSDHKAVIVNCDVDRENDKKSVEIDRTKVTIYDLNPNSLHNLSDVLLSYNWSAIIIALDNCLADDQFSLIYSDFIKIVKYLLHSAIPSKTVSMSYRDPPFITPQIKVLLRKRNKLRRRGKIQEADVKTSKINKLIERNRSKFLTNANSQDVSKMWSMVKASGSWRQVDSAVASHFTADELNGYFVEVATDPVFNKQHFSTIVENCLIKQHGDFCEWSDYFIYESLSRIKRTAAGFDGVPYWFFKLFASEISFILCKLINTSVRCGFIPEHWKKAIVTPIPKCHPLVNASDFRPISVTSVLCRLVEKLLVKTYFIPAFAKLELNDQYAYKPTGSTTGALVDITHRISILLETHEYVRCVLIDFSKAFDTVDHSILVTKLCQLDLPVFVLRWIINFLTDRMQCTKLGFKTSELLPITRSVVQGSGIGPGMFLVYISDLKALGKDNSLIKFADDCTLIVPAVSDVSVESEMNGIREWSVANKLSLNLNKTKEIVFHRPHPSKLCLPPPMLCDIERVQSAKLLGIYLTEKLSMAEHVEQTVAVCNQRLYLLCQLKRQNLSVDCLDRIFDAIIVSKLLYASQSWFGYINVEQFDTIRKLFAKAHRWGLTKNLYDADEMFEARDLQLFKSLCHPTHCLHHLLPPDKNVCYNLRKRGHSHELIVHKFKRTRNSYIVRVLYSNI